MEDTATAPTRVRNSRPRGKEPVGRERILEAAAELFVRKGYAATSTRDISAAVGIKQPSIYYHFSDKAAILQELLMRTTSPSITRARELAADASLGALPRLLALVEFDVRLLCAGPWNIGSLYLLPEVNSGNFTEFQNARRELKRVYADLLEAADAAGEVRVDRPLRAAAVIYSLVEGTILRRADEPDLDPDVTAAEIIIATRRILRVDV